MVTGRVAFVALFVGVGLAGCASPAPQVAAMLPEPSMSAIAAEASANAAVTTMPGGAVVVEAGQSAPPLESSAPSASPTPSVTETPTTPLVTATTSPAASAEAEASPSESTATPASPSAATNSAAPATASTSATPTPALTVTKAPAAAETATPLADFVAPTVIGVNAVGCQVIGAGTAFKHTYSVSLAGGRGWYYRDQRAPAATATVSELSPNRTITRDVISVSVGDNPGQSTGKLLNVKFPAPFVSECK